MAQDEKNPLGETVAMPPDSDPDATQLADAAPTRRVASEALPTIVLPSEKDAPEQPAEAGDGIDALGDPYFSPVVPNDLTEARVPVSIPSPVQSLPERKRRLPRWAVALIVVVLLACAGGVAYYTYDQELWGGKTIPRVVGLTQEEATRALESLGFAVSVEPVAADDGFGVVLACSPSEGQRVDPADGATISVASQRTIPQIVGMDVESAHQALLDAGAENVTLSYQNSDQPAGTVLAVSPEEGSAFVSSDPITVTVARAFTVPTLEGMSLSDAQAQLEAGGLTSSVIYVESDAEKSTVVSLDPPAGTEVAAGATITLAVATPMPSEPYDLMGYLEAAPQALSAYLADAGYALDYGEIYASGGNAHVAYTGASGDLIQITNEPETAHYAGGSQADVLARGAGVGGVRYAFSAETLPEGGATESESGIRAVMEACGLEGLLDTCTESDIVAPIPETEPQEPTEPEDPADEGGSGEDNASAGESTEPAHHFICGYGRQGDYTWAVIIGGYEGSTRVVALAAPTEHFSSVDLSSFGGSVCDYIAYIDQYTG